MPLSYELTAASVEEVRLVPELLGGVCLGENLARKFLGDLAYHSGLLGEKLAEYGIALVTERARQHGKRQQGDRILSKAVGCWLGSHNQRGQKSGREAGVRIISCLLPKQSSWLNAIEPKWIHSKRRL